MYDLARKITLMQKYISFYLLIILFSCSTISGQDRILFVVSNQTTYGNSTIKTANHFAEIVLAYDVFVKSGYEIDFVSPNGGIIPIGYINKSDSVQARYLDDSDFMDRFKNTLTPQQVNASNYKAVYYSGGGAAMYGVPENSRIQKISSTIYENNGVVSAICHGTAGIVNLKTTRGNYLYQGKQISGYPDMFERKNKAYYKEFPFSIEAKIRANKGKFEYSKKGWDSFYVTDGRLVTGQDPSASTAVAKAVVVLLKK